MDEDTLPGSGRATQPTVLVSGQARELLQRVPLQLLANRGERGDGAVVLTTREDPAVVARRLCGAVDAFEPALTTMVDATSTGGRGLTSVDDRRWQVPSPVSFAHIGRAVDAAREALRARGVDRIHFLFDSPTVQFRLADAAVVHRHSHDLVMAVGSERGLGLFTLAPSVTTDEEFDGMRHLVDVHVALRRTAGGPEVRWTGLTGTSDGWQPLADAGFRFDALGKSLG